MLCDGEGTKCSVKCSSGSRDLALLHQKLTVVHPYARHLVKVVGLRNVLEY